MLVTLRDLFIDLIEPEKIRDAQNSWQFTVNFIWWGEKHVVHFYSGNFYFLFFSWLENSARFNREKIKTNICHIVCLQIGTYFRSPFLFRLLLILIRTKMLSISVCIRTFLYSLSLSLSFRLIYHYHCFVYSTLSFGIFE